MSAETKILIGYNSKNEPIYAETYAGLLVGAFNLAHYGKRYAWIEKNAPLPYRKYRQYFSFESNLIESLVLKKLARQRGLTQAEWVRLEGYLNQ